jgi:hypothetical protein
VRYVHSEGFPLDVAVEMIFVQGQARPVRVAAEELLGDRFCELRIEHGGQLAITVRDLTASDVGQLDQIARDCDVDGWMRVQPADPAVEAAWSRCRAELDRLRVERPGAFRLSPGTDTPFRQPPFDMQLAPWALDVAVDLHDQLGDFVKLQVGALPYPPDPEQESTWHAEHSPNRLAGPPELRVTLDGPLVVRSGHSAGYGLLLTNLGRDRVVVHTNGQLTATVADPATGQAVGGYVGAQIAPLVQFRADPNQTVRIPLFVATDSYVQRLGYAIPPGEWAIFATLELSAGETRDTPLLPITVTD